MNPNLKATSLLLVLALGCAPGGGVAPVAPPAATTLAYTAQAQPLTYVAADTGSVSMEIPSMGTMAVTFDIATTAELSMRAAGSQLEAVVRLTQLSGQANNPATGSVTVDNQVLPKDPARLTLNARGEVTAQTLPELNRSLREVASGATLYRAMLVRLPARAVSPGASWVDTVKIEDQLGTLNSSVESEQRSTYVGDTVVAGRKLARIETTMLNTVHVAGESGGMQLEQRLTGKGTQRALWDAARSVLVWREQEVNAAGVMTISAMPGGEIPVVQKTRSVVRLRDGGL